MRKTGKKVLAAVLALTMALTPGCKKKEKTTAVDAFYGTEAETEETSTESTANGDYVSTYVARDYASSENADFQAYLQQEFKDTVEENTMDYHYEVVDGSKLGVKEPETATWGDVDFSDEGLKNREKKAKEDYEKLIKFEDAALTEKERLTYDILKENAEINLSYYKDPYLHDAFSPMTGLQANIPDYFTDYPLLDKHDFENYISLMAQTKNYADSMLDFEKRRAEKGYFMSENNLNSVISQCDSFLNVKAGESHFMINFFNDKVDEASYLSDEEKADLKARHLTAFNTGMLASFKTIKTTLEGMRSYCKGDGALCEYEGGAEYYENYVLPNATGSKMSADEMLTYLENGINQDIMRMRTIATKNPTLYQAFIASGTDAIKSFDTMDVTEAINTLSKDYMAEFPEISQIPFKADYLDKAIEEIKTEAGVLAYYRQPAIDNPSDNVIMVNGARKDNQFHVLAHEGCPGHMYQYNYFLTTNPYPVRLIHNELGYMEGWAQYSASISRNYFNYGEGLDGLGELDFLNLELGYIQQSITDILVNYKGYDADKVAEYFNQRYGSNVQGTDVQPMIDSVTGDPASIMSYGSGYYLMRDLRTRAENALGDKFDPVEFHKAILETGPCKFDILQQQVDKYIDEKLK